MNSSGNVTNDGPEKFDPVRPPKWKHRHKWPKAWRVWSDFINWVWKTWPRNP